MISERQRYIKAALWVTFWFVVLCLSYRNAPMSPSFLLVAFVSGVLVGILARFVAKRNPQWLLIAYSVPYVLLFNISKDSFFSKEVLAQSYYWLVIQWICTYLPPFAAIQGWFYRDSNGHASSSSETHK